MSIDLTKLTPAPWRMERRYSNGCEIVPRIHCERSKDRECGWECGWVADCVGAPYLGYESTLVNAEFIALARNAFEVMMRRGWGVEKADDGMWLVKDIAVEAFSQRAVDKMYAADPFTALIEADKWYRENVE